LRNWLALMVSESFTTSKYKTPAYRFLEFMVDKTFIAPFGGREATLEISPAHRAGYR
jgi:hypothetical protein